MPDLKRAVDRDQQRRTKGIQGHIVAAFRLAIAGVTGAAIASGTASGARSPRARQIFPYVFALIAIALALIMAKGIEQLLGYQRIEHVELILLTAIVGIAIRYGLLPSLLATATASLGYDIFFLPPLYSVTISDPLDVVAFLLFSVVAVVISNMAAWVRAQSVAAKGRLGVVEALCTLGRELTAAATLDDIARAVAHQIADKFPTSVVLLLADRDALALRGKYPPNTVLDNEEMNAALLTWDGCAEVKPRADNSGTEWIFLPLRTGRRAIGLLGFAHEEPIPPAGDRRHLLEAIADQTALAIERVHLVAELDRARLTDEMERLRSALLNSVSHDLGTPLAIIRGSAESLRDRHPQGESSSGLIADIIDECDTLNRFIGSLLDMTKLDSGAIVPKFGLNDVRDIVAFALQLSKNALTNHRVELKLDPRPAPVYVDPVLLERALVNLFDNAAKYAPQGTTIRIQSAREGDMVCLRIVDQGKGIPPADVERIFDKFYRLESGEKAPAGTGLGLAIARGFVEAVRGTITAANRDDGVGAVFTITLPVGETLNEDAVEDRMVSKSEVGE